VDEEERATALARRVSEDAAIDVFLTDRHGRETRLAASLINQKLFATNSARERAVFEIHRDSLRFFPDTGK
jgi:hypothetical protein